MRCPSCCINLPSSLGPTHEFLPASPACWALYCEILTHQFNDTRFSPAHRLTVDAYYAQHPNQNHPTGRRYLAVHLSRLYLLIERGWQVESDWEASRTIDDLRLADPRLKPPSMSGTLTIHDVASAQTPEEHASAVQAWAESVWKAWAPHHKTIRSWFTRHKGDRRYAPFQNGIHVCASQSQTPSFTAGNVKKMKN